MFVLFWSFDWSGVSIDLYKCLFIYLFSLHFVLCLSFFFFLFFVMMVYIHFLWSVWLLRKCWEKVWIKLCGNNRSQNLKSRNLIYWDPKKKQIKQYFQLAKGSKHQKARGSKFYFSFFLRLGASRTSYKLSMLCINSRRKLREILGLIFIVY